jgi:hypothetical protein
MLKVLTRQETTGLAPITAIRVLTGDPMGERGVLACR